jgi:hypothetical protein
VGDLSKRAIGAVSAPRFPPPLPSPRAGRERGRATSCGYRVESRKGAVAWAKWHRPVSLPRSSNRTCGFPASGFPSGFIARPTAWRGVHSSELPHAELREDGAPRECQRTGVLHLVPPDEEVPDTVDDVMVDFLIGRRQRAIAEVGGPAGQEAVHLGATPCKSFSGRLGCAGPCSDATGPARVSSAEGGRRPFERPLELPRPEWPGRPRHSIDLETACRRGADVACAGAWPRLVAVRRITKGTTRYEGQCRSTRRFEFKPGIGNDGEEYSELRISAGTGVRTGVGSE